MNTMLRSQAIRASRSLCAARVVPAARTYATAPPPPPPSGQPAPNPKAKTSSGTSPLVLGGAVVGIAALTYWYLNNPEDAETLKLKAQHDEEEMRRKAREFTDSTKSRADDAYKQGQAKYGEYKAAGQDKVASVRSSVESITNDAESKARQAAADAQSKADSYKKSAQQSLSKARESTENLYDEARASTNKAVQDGKSEAKSWWGWGSSKAVEGKEDAAGKVAESAEDVRKKAEKHT